MSSTTGPSSEEIGELFLGVLVKVLLGRGWADLLGRRLLRLSVSFFFIVTVAEEVALDVLERLGTILGFLSRSDAFCSRFFFSLRLKPVTWLSSRRS